MVESSDEPPLLDRIRSKAHVFTLASRKADDPPILPLTDHTLSRDDVSNSEKPDGDLHRASATTSTRNQVADAEKASLPPPAPPPASETGQGEATPAIESGRKQPSMAVRFYETTKEILTYSVINVLLVFVPVGIAVEYAHVSPTIVFVINAIAVIPLAGLLAHATEAVAGSLGDTIGALLNVSFGNAVELIIFIIALTKDEIRIVQASIVGSILSNLLLILGMSFAFGGLRYREQLYNSTVTQMSACLLSLSVTSLLLPTAFHASFSDNALADQRVLELSRASAIILLVIYVLYLLFQLKSHAYMYESTPQHVIDEESHPGVLANMLNSSSSDSSSSSDTDSDGSSGSHKTAKKIKKALRAGRRRRKSSVSSKDSPSMPSTARSQSFIDVPVVASPVSEMSNRQLGAIASGDEADTDGERTSRKLGNKVGGTQARDFEHEKPAVNTGSGSNSPVAKSKKKHRKQSKRSRQDRIDGKERAEVSIDPTAVPTGASQQARVAFAPGEQTNVETASKRPLNIRTLSVRPAMPRFLGSTVFSESNATGQPAPAGVAVPKVPYGLRRTSSLPDRLNKPRSQPSGQSEPRPSQGGAIVPAAESSTDNEEDKPHMSRTSAVILLLISTALVALCAEYLVGSINYMVTSTPVSQAFIGLIILPVVGNAAEHVTAVTVATKNKMDLAIGVAVGSSIQIALFVTPFIILLGWWLNKEMSLFFSLFETISLFVSAFIINFLILDGRSNYLEGALLMAAYIIIAVAAWFYPNEQDQSDIGGAANDHRMMLMARGISMLTGRSM